MPRLLIVIDEFASLARELPDFVTGLVNIAQRGRSLGIHLILATQRPGGVVSPEIRANTNLRIALRVTDATECTDVIDAPDAGRHLQGDARSCLRRASGPPPWSPSSPGGSAAAARARSRSSAAKPWVSLVGLRDLADPPSYRPAPGDQRRRRDHRPHGAGRGDP